MVLVFVSLFFMVVVEWEESLWFANVTLNSVCRDSLPGAVKEGTLLCSLLGSTASRVAEHPTGWKQAPQIWDWKMPNMHLQQRGPWKTLLRRVGVARVSQCETYVAHRPHQSRQQVPHHERRQKSKSLHPETAAGACVSNADAGLSSANIRGGVAFAHC